MIPTMELKESYSLRSKVLSFSRCDHKAENGMTHIKELGCIRKEFEEAEKSLDDILNTQRRSSYDDTDSRRSEVNVGSAITYNLLDKIQKTLVVVVLTKMIKKLEKPISKSIATIKTLKLKQSYSLSSIIINILLF
jgi:hypothetical protein